MGKLKPERFRHLNAIRSQGNPRAVVLRIMVMPQGRL